MNNFYQYVYIMSAGHSGSTLLDLLLGSHSHIVSIGEISHLPKNISLNNKCSCGRNIKSCLYWNNILRQIIKETNIDVFNEPYKFHLGLISPAIIKDTRHKSLRYRFQRKICMSLNYFFLYHNLFIFNNISRNIASSPKNNFLLYDKVLTFSDANVVVDSSKIYQKGIDLYNFAPNKVKIILLSRDGRGVMYSNMKKNVYSRKKALKGWVRYYKHAQTLIKKYVPQSHIYSLTYESLVNSPVSELKSICKFLNLDFQESMIDFAAHEHHITNGNDMRFSNSSDIRMDLSWKNNLSKDDLDYFNKYASHLNHSLGHL